MSEVVEAPVSAVVTVSQGARLAGVARSTVNRKIKAGELSRAQGGGVQIVELERVFGKLKTPEEVEAEEMEQGGATGQSAPADAPVQSGAGTPRWLIEQMERLQDQNDVLLERLAEKDEVLREAEARADRKEETWMRQIDKLTHLLPAPEPVAPTPAKQGWLERFFNS